jgi:hypothetical protein
VEEKENDVADNKNIAVQHLLFCNKQIVSLILIDRGITKVHVSFN